MTRRNPWKRLREGIEGPTVTVQLPREWAEELLNSLMTSLEMDDGADGDGDMDDMGLDDPEGDLDMGDMGPPEDDEMDDFSGFSAGGDEEPDFPAGDGPDDEGDDEAPPKKKGPGRPPGSKNKKKDDKGKKDKPKSDDDGGDDDEDSKDEAADYAHSGGDPSGLRTGTAFGESAFLRAGRLLREATVRRGPRRRK